MKRNWERPSVMVQEFEANEYVAACWGVGCTIDKANEYESTHYYKQSGGKYGKGITWAEFGCSHALDHCGYSGNQVIYDDNNDGTPDRMTEIGTDGLGTLACTLYADGTYTTTRTVGSVKTGETIYWTTAADDGRVWHHVGVVSATVPNHPNRS